MNKVKIVFFDCDGVVIFGNPWLRLHRAMNVSPELDREWYDAYSRGEITYDEWNQKVVDHYKDQGLTREKYEEILDIKNFELNEEAIDLINFIKSQNIHFAFISSGIEFYISQIAKHFGTEYYHANAVFHFAEDGSFTKTTYTDVDPKAKVIAINDFCQKLGLNPEESLFIGDANNDLDAFRHTKRGLLYRTTNPNHLNDSWWHKDDELQKAAWRKIDNLRSVIDIIKEINGI